MPLVVNRHLRLVEEESLQVLRWLKHNATYTHPRSLLQHQSQQLLPATSSDTSTASSSAAAALTSSSSSHIKASRKGKRRRSQSDSDSDDLANGEMNATDETAVVAAQLDEIKLRSLLYSQHRGVWLGGFDPLVHSRAWPMPSALLRAAIEKQRAAIYEDDVDVDSEDEQLQDDSMHIETIADQRLQQKKTGSAKQSRAASPATTSPAASTITKAGAVKREEMKKDDGDDENEKSEVDEDDDDMDDVMMLHPKLREARLKAQQEQLQQLTVSASAGASLPSLPAVSPASVECSVNVRYEAALPRPDWRRFAWVQTIAIAAIDSTLHRCIGVVHSLFGTWCGLCSGWCLCRLDGFRHQRMFVKQL